MLTSEQLGLIAQEAGDEVFPGLWITSDHAQRAAILDMYDDSKDKAGPEWATVRAELLEHAAEITDRIEQQKRREPDAR